MQRDLINNLFITHPFHLPGRVTANPIRSPSKCQQLLPVEQRHLPVELQPGQRHHHQQQQQQRRHPTTTPRPDASRTAAGDRVAVGLLAAVGHVQGPAAVAQRVADERNSEVGDQLAAAEGEAAQGQVAASIEGTSSHLNGTEIQLDNTFNIKKKMLVKILSIVF